MANRNSQVVNAHKGQNTKTTLKGGQFSTDYGPEGRGPSPELAKLLGEPTIPASVKTIEFNVVKAFLMKRGTGEKAAVSLTLLLIDAAKLNSTSVMKLLESLNTESIAFSDTVQYLLNKLNNSTNLVGTAQIKDNSESYKANYIRA